MRLGDLANDLEYQKYEVCFCICTQITGQWQSIFTISQWSNNDNIYYINPYKENFIL